MQLTVHVVGSDCQTHGLLMRIVYGQRHCKTQTLPLSSTTHNAAAVLRALQIAGKRRPLAPLAVSRAKRRFSPDTFVQLLSESTAWHTP